MSTDITGTETFTNGPYQVPTDTDVGNDVFSLLEEYMERMATHSHGGADSKKITLNIEKDIHNFVRTVDLAWNIEGNDTYKAVFPTAELKDFDDTIRRFYYSTDLTNWIEFYPTIEKIDSTSYHLYANANDIDVRVVTL